LIPELAAVESGVPFGRPPGGGNDVDGVDPPGALIPPCLRVEGGLLSAAGGVNLTTRLLRLQNGQAGGPLLAFFTNK
jgi:hypothetical protein